MSDADADVIAVDFDKTLSEGAERVRSPASLLENEWRVTRASTLKKFRRLTYLRGRL